MQQGKLALAPFSPNRRSNWRSDIHEVCVVDDLYASTWFLKKKQKSYEHDLFSPLSSRY